MIIKPFNKNTKIIIEESISTTSDVENNPPSSAIVQKSQQKAQQISNNNDSIVNSKNVDDLYILVTTIWGEARGEGEKGMWAVLNVILNRAGKDINKAAQIALKPKQFSCWNKIENPNEYVKKLANVIHHSKGKTSKDSVMYEKALELVDKAAKKELNDITGGAQFYFNPNVVKPEWSKKMIKTTTIGNHEFYKLQPKKKINENIEDNNIIVGVIFDDESIESSDEADFNHDDLIADIPMKTRRNVKCLWRYNKINHIVYWWPFEPYPTEDDKESVDYYLKKEYNVNVIRHEFISGKDEKDREGYRNQYNKAHGLFGSLLEENNNNNNKIKVMIKQLIIEGIKENTALEFLSDLVKKGPYKGRVFLAGGAVRDMEMGLSPKDLDVVVTGDINSGMDFAKWATQTIGNYKENSNPVLFPTYGTAKFTLQGVEYKGIDLSDIDVEAVATRKEQYTAGSRKPAVTGGELKDDVERRDFTVNSLLKDLTTGEILDLTGMGKGDIQKGIIRTPLDPDKIFTDDPLRMLRSIRFATKYNWKLPLFMLRGLKKNASQLTNISQERIRDELDKMLFTNEPSKAIKLLKVTGLLQYVIPELIPAIKMVQNKHHSKDVFGHTLDVLSKTQPVLIQRLTSLLHDIGKTVTKTVEPETGNVHFYGHEAAGEKIVEDVMIRLKYPTEIINAVKLGVRNHMRLKHAGDTGVKISDKALLKFRNEMGEQLENILNVINADNISHADASSMPNQITNIRQRLENIKNVPTKPKLPISGFDVIKILGIKPGPIFKDIMNAVTEEWYIRMGENKSFSKEEALEIAKKIADNNDKTL